jgi:hypothetical protein
MIDGKPQKIVIDNEDAFALWNQGREAWDAYVSANPSSDLKSIGSGSAHPVLKGQAAIALWLKGKEVWNSWVSSNPCADVNWNDIEFPCNAKDYNGADLIDFSEFIFPEGDIIFDYSSFLRGNVSFYGASFSRGELSFFNAKFGKGELIFDNAIFSGGKISFMEASFGRGWVSFSDAKFGEGDLVFTDAKFSGGDINFDSTTFTKGKVIFNGAKFGNGVLNFDDAKLGDVDVDFRGATFGSGSILLRNLAFKGMARFDNLKGLERCAQFSFEGCSFDKPFTFSHHDRMGCPLDLRRTKLAHGIILNDVRCDYQISPPYGWRGTHRWLYMRTFKRIPRRLYRAITRGAHLIFRRFSSKAVEREDSQRFRRLKELALSEANHYKALEFNAQELRSQRRHETEWLRDRLQFCYMALSNYGRSVVRPTTALVIVTLVHAAIYSTLATKPKLAPIDAFSAGMTYSGGNMFAFVPIGRTALQQSSDVLFLKEVPYDVLWIGGFQSVLSVILLFLLGLGLRNMFRL